MVSSHPLCLAMKYLFEKFVVKCLCQKVFGRLVLSSAFIVIAESFLKLFFEIFQFKVAMCFQSLGIKSIMILCILSCLTLERPSFF